MASRAAFMPFTYATEDGALLLTLLEEGRYDVVVGNPPYITVKDKALNQIYRSKYADVCKGKYALTVPFMKLFFALAKDGERPGWVGQITSNSFMKREFGAKLIEDFLARKDLRLVADTSGAYIPGHGTPTVILVGRNQQPVGRPSVPYLASAANPADRTTRPRESCGPRSLSMSTLPAGTTTGSLSLTWIVNSLQRIHGHSRRRGSRPAGSDIEARASQEG